MESNKGYSGHHPNFAQTLIESRFVSHKYIEEKSLSAGLSEEDVDADYERKERKEVLYNGFYYDVTDWIDKHPGGDLIKFYTEEGEDATHAISQFHNRSEKRVMAIMKSFKRRPATSQEIVRNTRNAETQKRHEALTEDFNALFQQLKDEGFFKPSLVHVALRILECVFYGVMGMVWTQSDYFAVQVLGTICLILLSARTGWLQHEGGHHSLTGYPMLDRFVQAGAFGIGSGLSSSWFRHFHNKHHAMPQRFTKDADLDTMPMLAFNKKVVENPNDKKGFLLQNQAALFFGVDTFIIGLYWKLYLHPKNSITGGKFDEMLFLLIHYGCSYYVGFWPVFTAAFFGSIILMGNISLSHLHFPLVNERLHWVEYALAHTTDIEPSYLCDWWMGYLNYQIEHHLFPTMPQYRNYQIRDRVKALASKHNIPYHCCTYSQAVVNCLKNLDHVSKELREECE